ncbi:MAG: CinA family nicotinamide mononucleotide deamidase-related protein [Anaerolineae bacterium]|nr:CinA family nicotinamide mononucleotide deamidase-related protein [Anaerolineae bacterium]
MRAEIISIGEELLSGDTDIVDTNSVFIAKQLRAIGIHVYYKSTVGDHEERITEVILNALGRADVIITSGGLGPTVDDMTRQGVANAIGRPLIFYQDLMDILVEKFKKFGVRMSENNRVQATLPETAIPIVNPVGTAPGFIVNYAGRIIMSVPGVPREMKYLMENTVIPYLKEQMGPQGIIKTRVLRTAGIGESLLDEQVGEFEKGENPAVGLAAHMGQVDIRIYAKGATEAEADSLIANVEEKIRQRVGQYIFGADRDPLEGAFIAALKQSGVKAYLAELGTGGILRSMIEAQGGAEQIESVPADEIEAFKTQFMQEDYREEALSVARAIWEQHKPALVITVLSDQPNAAIAITNGSDVRSRAYAYGDANSENSGAAGMPAEWTTRWSLSMAWWLLTSMAK